MLKTIDAPVWPRALAPGSRLAKNALRVGAALVALVPSALASDHGATVAITVSMERPSAHYLHVEMRCEGLADATQDFKMPAWTPGYYQIMDFARGVRGFRAEDGLGKPLRWEKTNKNTWRVQSGRASTVTASYDAYAFGPSVADSFLDDRRAYISPASVFMYPAGQLRRPVKLIVKPLEGWGQIATGLDPVEGQPGSFVASDFDILYDCPILAGNQDVATFEVRGVRHRLVLDEMGNIDRGRVTADLARIVEASAVLIGEIPYDHYSFMAMGGGLGGLEHRNSTALFIDDPESLNEPVGYKRWLAFVAHEFFHLYNAKRIRPVALGPFDYDRENYTRMLWVAEGLTVYYEHLVLRRAGLISQDELLERLGSSIASHENAPGRLVQSVTDASFDTWIQFFHRDGNVANSTVSYYDKGAVLGLLLDLAIRHETDNRRSLDDVMRGLYRDYDQGKGRGFTDLEFRQACERAAGVALPEIFDSYASGVAEIDYARYLAHGGLTLATATKAANGGWLGLTTEARDGALVVAGVAWDSPAQKSGLSVRDEILAWDDARVTPKGLDHLLTARKPGDRIRLLIARRGKVQELTVELGASPERTFRLRPVDQPTERQRTLLDDWLRGS